MELLERESYMASLQTEFQNVAQGEGRCVLVAGEAGIGKTSLVKNFYSAKKKSSKIFIGSCDALFTPRPLAPLYDILLQMQGEVPEDIANIHDRTGLFLSFLREVERQNETPLIIIEDVHWADEATADFIKFFARRVSLFQCLFILTYRDTEIGSQHPLRNVLGQLPSGSFTRLELTALSRQTVERMAIERGYNGEDVYNISRGNPFYVSEILASYSSGVPGNVKDSIMSSYDRLDEKTRELWQILSVLPTGLEIKSFQKVDSCFNATIHNGLNSGILVLREKSIFFKHELYRRTVEESLSPFLRMALNKKILDLFQDSYEQNGQIERIIHHAKGANAFELVMRFAPMAAQKAAAVGAHIEASRLYLSAIEYYPGNDPDVLIQLYWAYAYECYLTSQLKEAIIYAGNCLHLLEDKKDIERIGECLHFLSWLYWFDGNRKKSESYAVWSIDIFADQPPSNAKAMAHSNMGRLKGLWDEKDECLLWSEKALEMSQQLADEKTLCHALNSMGSLLSRNHSSRDKGLELSRRSMDIAVKNNYEEYISHAYGNVAGVSVTMKDYSLATKMLEEGIKFCEERDIDLGVQYLQMYNARLHLETGKWNEAHDIAENFIASEEQSSIIKIGASIIATTIKMRRGDSVDVSHLVDVMESAFKTQELQRIIPVLNAALEYEWLTGQQFIEKANLDYGINAVGRGGNIYETSAFAFWFWKARKEKVAVQDFYEGYLVNDKTNALKAAALWKKLCCPYEEALTLFEGDVEEKREAISLVKKLGADAVYDKLKYEMRRAGIKSIPRGIRENTRSNPAHLTERELQVLQLLTEGLQNKEIGRKLFISSKTVDNHLTSIFLKLNVHSRAKAIEQAIRMQILK